MGHLSVGVARNGVKWRQMDKLRHLRPRASDGEDMALDQERVTSRPHDHVVRFYRDDADLVRAIGGALLNGVVGNDAVVIVATPDHRELFRATFREAGIDVPAHEARGELVFLDAQATMDRFIEGDTIDPQRFHSVLGGLLREVRSEGRTIRVYGEMVALLWDAGQIPLVIELEELWNELARELTFTLYCGYQQSHVESDGDQSDFAKICRLHSSSFGMRENSELVPSSRAVGEVLREFTPDTRAPSEARAFALAAVNQLGRSDAREIVALVVSELATNAVLHAATNFTVSIAKIDGCIRVEVQDKSLDLPERRNPQPFETNGRGLRIVERLADRWGIDVNHDTKIIWAEIA